MRVPVPGPATPIGRLPATAAVACIALTACGSAEPSAALRAPCERAPAAAIARFTGVGVGALRTARAIANTGAPQCTYRLQLASGVQVKVVVDVDSSPSPYFVLEETAVGDAQVFAPGPLIPPPQAITGLGLMADWFPQYPDLEATDGYRLVTVTVTWRGMPQRRLRALAIVVARPYMHPPVGQQAIDRLIYGAAPG